MNDWLALLLVFGEEQLLEVLSLGLIKIFKLLDHCRIRLYLCVTFKQRIHCTFENFKVVFVSLDHIEKLIELIKRNFMFSEVI